MFTVFGSLSPQSEPVSITPMWESAEIKDVKTEAESAQIYKELGVPDSEVYALLGYSPEQVAQFAREARQDQAATIANIAGAIRVNEIRNQQQTNPELNGEI